MTRVKGSVLPPQIGGAAGGRRAQDGGFPTLSYGPGPLVPMNLLLVLMVLLVIVLTYMARHGGYGP
jgi:hypothetical protein